jgi:hypothetical protein
MSDHQPHPDDSPAGIVQQAIEYVDMQNESDERNTAALVDLLRTLRAEMHKEEAVEVEFFILTPSQRWKACDSRVCRGADTHRGVDRWTAALALARAILDLPNPNAVSEETR